MNKKTLKVLQISDTHLFADKRGTLIGRNTWNSFTAVRDRILVEHSDPDVILVTGDVSQDYSDGSYTRLEKGLSMFTCPIYWIPGNHDHAAQMDRVLAQTALCTDKEIVTDHWHIVLLDSSVDGKVYGELSEAECQRIEKSVSAYPDKHFMVALHHHPVSVNVEWLEGLGLKNADRFREIISKHENLRAVIWGHIHHVFEKVEAGVHYLSVPSTCIQFSPDSAAFSLDTLGPGYRWFELSDDGGLETGVVRVKHYEDGIDYSSSGY